MRPELYKKCVVSPRPGNSFKVLEPLLYNDIKVPVGYITDGANIPRIFWILWPPNKTDYLPAVILHDYMCSLGEYRKADKYFRDYMKLQKV
jgi:hypothetical protein